MQQIIEEILKTEGDCAQRLVEERKTLESRRAEIEAKNAERVRLFREQMEAASAQKLTEHQERLRREGEETVRRAESAAEEDFAGNREVLDRIVDRIVELVTGVDRGS